MSTGACAEHQEPSSGFTDKAFDLTPPDAGIDADSNYRDPARCDPLPRCESCDPVVSLAFPPAYTSAHLCCHDGHGR